MRNVMSSAAEAECGALFNNTKDGVALRNTLAEGARLLLLLFITLPNNGGDIMFCWCRRITIELIPVNIPVG
jgi:hypothetical protein